jgi:hypothetical protein
MEIENFVVKEGKFEEFQKWVKKNEGAFAAWGKKSGYKYLGTYYYAMGTGAQLHSHGCFMFELSRYGDIDKSLTLFKDPEDERIARESLQFMEYTPTPTLLLRPFGEGLFYKGT